MTPELLEAEAVLPLCDRWHKTPDEILAMDARAFYLMDVFEKGHRDLSG